MQFINYHFQMNQITLSCSLSVAIRYLFAISTVQICPQFFQYRPYTPKNRTKSVCGWYLIWTFHAVRHCKTCEDNDGKTNGAMCRRKTRWVLGLTGFTNGTERLDVYRSWRQEKRTEDNIGHPLRLCALQSTSISTVQNTTVTYNRLSTHTSCELYNSC